MENDDEITRYLQFIKDIFDHKQQGPMLSGMFKAIERDYLKIQEEGDIAKHRIVKESFAHGILELLQHKDYDATKIFSNKSMKSLNRLYSQAELEELKDSFLLIKKNLTSTIQRIPV